MMLKRLLAHARAELKPRAAAACAGLPDPGLGSTAHTAATAPPVKTNES